MRGDTQDMDPPGGVLLPHERLSKPPFPPIARPGIPITHLLEAAALQRRMEVAGDSTLDYAAKSLIISRAVGIVSPRKDIHLDAAVYEVMAATALMAADAQQAGENSTQGVIYSLLAAAGLLLTTLLLMRATTTGHP
ncbi:MAG TPA: hypothetical protein VGD84_25050 [Pseudonocardiaceae bacterium]